MELALAELSTQKRQDQRQAAAADAASSIDAFEMTLKRLGAVGGSGTSGVLEGSERPATSWRAAHKHKPHMVMPPLRASSKSSGACDTAAAAAVACWPFVLHQTPLRLVRVLRPHLGAYAALRRLQQSWPTARTSICRSSRLGGRRKLPHVKTARWVGSRTGLDGAGHNTTLSLPSLGQLRVAVLQLSQAQLEHAVRLPCRAAAVILRPNSAGASCCPGHGVMCGAVQGRRRRMLVEQQAARSAAEGRVEADCLLEVLVRRSAEEQKLAQHLWQLQQEKVRLAACDSEAACRHE